MTEEQVYILGGIIPEARMKECYGNWTTVLRTKWPATYKEFRGEYQEGQSWITIAIAQARALEPFVDVEKLPKKWVPIT